MWNKTCCVIPILNFKHGVKEAACSPCYYFHFLPLIFFPFNLTIWFDLNAGYKVTSAETDNFKILFPYCYCSKLYFVSLDSSFQVLVSAVGLYFSFLSFCHNIAEYLYFVLLGVLYAASVFVVLW